MYIEIISIKHKDKGDKSDKSLKSLLFTDEKLSEPIILRGDNSDKTNCKAGSRYGIENHPRENLHAKNVKRFALG